jgi:hypothetical protein
VTSIKITSSMVVVSLASVSPLCRQEDAYAASKRLLKMAGVSLRQHQMDRPFVLTIGSHGGMLDIASNQDSVT